MKPKILIADSPAGAGPLGRLLSANGYNVETASVKMDAETALYVWKPDLVIVNIFCRTLSPLEFLASASSAAAMRPVKTLVLSCQPSAQPALAQGWLQKPVEFSQLKPLLLKCAGAAGPGNRIPVLLADADPKSSGIIKMYLETGYYRPVLAPSAEAVLAALKEQPPAAIIMDPLLPDASGFELLRGLRESGAPLPPVIIETALRLGEFHKKGLLTGGPELVAAELPEELALSAVAGALAAPAAASGQRPRVLLAEDDPVLLSLMREVLDSAGFDAATACDGGEALEKIRKSPPDIAALDYDMPVLDGLAVIAALKDDSLLANLPVMLLSAAKEKQLKLKALNLGADDFMPKPIDTDEFTARLRMILRRTRQVLDANPLTRLPGNPSIAARIERAIAGGGAFAVLYADINQFKPYNDSYGFDAGDRVIKAVADILVSRVKRCDGGGFIGHIGGDDFIAVTALDCAEELAQGVLSDFDAAAPSFYNDADRARGYIESTDRLGREQRFPFVSLAIGIAHNRLRRLTSLGQISSIGTELKHYAKRNSGSSYAVDRRSDNRPAGA
ncbi:MAG: response regulator [Elusimicrobiales bacterium]